MSERDIAKSIGAFVAFVSSFATYRTCLYLGLDYTLAAVIGGAVFILGGIVATLWAKRYPDSKPPPTPAGSSGYVNAHMELDVDYGLDFYWGRTPR